MLLSFLLSVQLARAADSSLKVVDDADGATVHARWEDANGKAREVRARLDRRDLSEARNHPLVFDLAPIYGDVAQDVRAWARREGHDLTVTVKGEDLRMVAKADTRAAAKRILEEATGIRDAAFDRALPEHRLRRLARGGLTADHAGIARDASDDVADLARALADGTDDPRVFANRAISFVQSIPYKAGGDRGLKLPLRVLELGSGDCDSKSTLFLALMRAAHPSVRTAIVYVPGHAFVGLDLPVHEGDDTATSGGRTWVLAEPVGPRVEKVGWASRKSRRLLRKKGELVEVPR
jgi:hypothetical protein